ncbi:hypothetical protein [Achromobacter sp. EB05]|uniref:hypothetical protein n=1 Tax=Achromobacter sp. EB05 TaxID=3142974 RepID=UPI0037831544
MSMFIHHTLMMLEDAGMSIKYPQICHITLDEDGRGRMHAYHSLIQGRRVSVEQNQQMKFLMLFTLLDFHVDASYPKLEGKGYREKYESLPAQGDYNLILRQLFRVAKVIRNALVHNQSSFDISEGKFSVDYRRGKHHFCLSMSWEEFQDFQTAIIMYVKGDMGKGSYFMGIMRSMYASILAGITQFNDEFGSAFEQPTTGIKMKRHVRQIVMHPPYETRDDRLHFPSAARETPEWEGLDLYIVRNDKEFLVPREALDEDLSLTEHDLIADWKREGHYPQVMAP